MNISGFDDCLNAANEIQSNTQGEVANHLGNKVNSPIDTADHIAQFNNGLNTMQTLHGHHIPLSESVSYSIDNKVISGVVDTVETWLKNKLMSDNEIADKSHSDYSLDNKTSFLKDMQELFSELPEEAKNDIVSNISKLISSYDIKSVRGLISKIKNLPK